MTIPLPAIAPPRVVALAWLKAVMPDLQAGKSLLTPADSWATDFFATVSNVANDLDSYTPIRDAHIQIDVWGRPSPSQQYRGVPLNECDAIVEHLEDLTIHFNPLMIDFSATSYKNVYIADAYATDKSSAISEKPSGSSQVGSATVALSRARLTVCLIYKIP